MRKRAAQWIRWRKPGDRCVTWRSNAINMKNRRRFADAFQLETIYAADGLAIDAFDQPAVEAGKIRANIICRKWRQNNG